jgi:hypothetical protein
MDQLQKSLFKRWQEERLGHFYILNHNSNLSDFDRRNHMTKWVEELIVEIVIAQKGCSKKDALNTIKCGISDLTVIDRGKDSGKNYRIEELKELLNFHQYRPFEWKIKFALVNDTHRITDIIFNKLLKMLEGEAGRGCVFFLNWSGAPFPATINSRAISLTIPSHPNGPRVPPSGESQELLTNYLAGNLSESQLIGKLKVSPARQQEIISQIIELKTKAPKGYRDHQQFFQLLAHVEECSIYHNMAASRLFQLLKSCIN